MDLLLFLPGVDASHVYMRALALGCFYSQYRNFLDGADHIVGQLRGDKVYPFSGITKSGRVWRKVLESDARSVTPIATVKLSSLLCSESVTLGYYHKLLTMTLAATTTKFYVPLHPHTNSKSPL